MTAREQAGDSKFYRLILAYDNFTNLLRERLNVIRHCGMICGDDAFRKHDVGESFFGLATFIDTNVPPLHPANQAFLRIFAVVSLPGQRSVRVVGRL